MSDISDQGLLPPYIDSPRQGSPAPQDDEVGVPDEEDGVKREDEPQNGSDTTPAVPIEKYEPGVDPESARTSRLVQDGP